MDDDLVVSNEDNVIFVVSVSNTASKEELIIIPTSHFTGSTICVVAKPFADALLPKWHKDDPFQKRDLS